MLQNIDRRFVIEKIDQTIEKSKSTYKLIQQQGLYNTFFPPEPKDTYTCALTQIVRQRDASEEEQPQEEQQEQQTNLFKKAFSKSLIHC